MQYILFNYVTRIFDSFTQTILSKYKVKMVVYMEKRLKKR